MNPLACESRWIFYIYNLNFLNNILYLYCNKIQTNMTSFRTNEEIIKEFCEKNMSTHTDWTGTRVETKNKCNSVDEFVHKLMEYIEDNHYRC